MRVRIGLVIGIAWISAGCGNWPMGADPPSVAPAVLEQQAKDGGYRLLSVKYFYERVATRSNMIIIDASPQVISQREHILGATSYSFPDAESMGEWNPNAGFGGPTPEDFARTLGPDKSIPIVVYSENSASRRSHLAASWARKLGYTEVERLSEGLAGWKKAGHETRSISVTP